MRLIKLGFFSIVFLGLLLTVISLLMPSTILVSKSININAPYDTVYSYISNLKQWQKWCANMEGATLVYSQNTTGKNASVQVDKTNIIIDSATSTAVYTTWKSSSTVLNASFNILSQSTSATTALQWQFVNHVPWYPWEKFAAIFSDKTIGGFMEKSLDKLKITLESQP